MKIYSHIVTIGCFFLTVACSQDRLTTVLPEPIRLDGVRILESQFGIRDIEHVDSLIILSTEHEPLFRVFLKNGQYKGGFGRIGNGPSEFPAPRSNYFADIGHFKNRVKFLINNPRTNVMLLIDMDESISKNETVVQEEYALPRELSSAWGPDVYLINDSLLIGMYEDRFDKRLDEKRGFFYYQINTRMFDILSLTNLYMDTYNLNASMNINARGSDITPNRSKVVMPYLFIPQIDIIDVHNKSVESITLEGLPLKSTFSLEDFNNERIIQYYGSTYVTNDKIYVKYIGKIPAENQDYVIQVMDWSGDVQAQYIIGNEYKLIRFIVDEENSIIYGLSSELDALYEFKY